MTYQEGKITKERKKLIIFFSELRVPFVRSFENRGLTLAEGTLRFVIPAKAGIQANSAEKQTWIPACAGMTLEEKPSSAQTVRSHLLWASKLTNQFVVKLRPTICF
jgi:hypothetical protein